MPIQNPPPPPDPTGNPFPPPPPPEPCNEPVEPAAPSAADLDAVAEEQAIANATAPAGVPIEVAATTAVE